MGETIPTRTSTEGQKTMGRHDELELSRGQHVHVGKEGPDKDHHVNDLTGRESLFR